MGQVKRTVAVVGAEVLAVGAGVMVAPEYGLLLIAAGAVALAGTVLWSPLAKLFKKAVGGATPLASAAASAASVPEPVNDLMLIADASREMYNLASDATTAFVAGNSTIEAYRAPENYFAWMLKIYASGGSIQLHGARGPGLKIQRIPVEDVQKILVVHDSKGYPSSDVSARPLWERISVTRRDALASLERFERSEGGRPVMAQGLLSSSANADEPKLLSMAEAGIRLFDGASKETRDFSQTVGKLSEASLTDYFERMVLVAAKEGLTELQGRRSPDVAFEVLLRDDLDGLIYRGNGNAGTNSYTRECDWYDLHVPALDIERVQELIENDDRRKAAFQKYY